MQNIATNFDLLKIPFVHFCLGSRPILTPKIKHVHLLVLIWERLHTPTPTTMPTTTMPEATVWSLGRYIASYSIVHFLIGLTGFVQPLQMNDFTFDMLPFIPLHFLYTHFWQSINQSINQSVNQSINQSVNVKFVWCLYMTCTGTPTVVSDKQYDTMVQLMPLPSHNFLLH